MNLKIGKVVSRDLGSTVDPHVVQMQEDQREEELMESRNEAAPLRAHDLKGGLVGSYEDRLKETKTILIRISGTTRPVVTFSGWWNGRMVNKAMNAVSREYRLTKHKQIRSNREVRNEEAKN